MRRRRLLTLFGFAIALIPGILVPLRLPDLFQATAIVTVEGTPEVLGFGLDYESAAGSATALITSERVLGLVAGREAETGERPSRRRMLDRALGLFGIERDVVEPGADVIRRQRINGLRGSLYVEAPRGSRDVQISYRAYEPEAAAYYANAVADAFVEQQEDQRQRALRRAIRFLSQKASEIRDRIRRREEAVAQLVASGDIQPGEAGEHAVRERDDMASDLRAAKMERLLLEQRIAQLRPLVGDSTTGGAVRDPETEELIARLSEVRSRLDGLKLQFTSTHPEIIRLEQMQSDLAAQLGADPAELRPTFVDPSLAQELRRLRTEHSVVQARIVVLQKTLKEEASAQDLEAVAEYDRLNREVDIDRQMLQVVLQRMNETAMNAGGPSEGARVLEYAVRPLRPYAPDRALAHGIGVVLALGFGVGLGVLREMLDQRVYDPDRVARMLGTSFLGNVPVVLDGSDPGHQSALLYSSPAGESFRNLRTSLLFSTGGSRLRSVLVTSAVAGEGKTTVTSNLAAAFANVGRRVLLIDADMRRPRVDQVFSLDRSPGLSEVLRSELQFDQAVRKLDEGQPDVLTSGAIPDNPTELLSSPAFDLLFARARKTYDIVMIDAPILLAVADALLLSARVDGVLLVHRPGSVDHAAFTRIAADLHRMDANVLGLVFNQVDLHDPYQYPSYLRSPYVAGSARRRRWRIWRRDPRSDAVARGKDSS